MGTGNPLTVLTLDQKNNVGVHDAVFVECLQCHRRQWNYVHGDVRRKSHLGKCEACGYLFGKYVQPYQNKAGVLS